LIERAWQNARILVSLDWNKSLESRIDYEINEAVPKALHGGE
jgi:hypothetical protein